MVSNLESTIGNPRMDSKRKYNAGGECGNEVKQHKTDVCMFQLIQLIIHRPCKVVQGSDSRVLEL